MENQIIKRFQDLFSGYENAYGVFIPEGKDEKGKVSGKCITKKEPTPVHAWKQHLNGGKGLGQIPLHQDDTVTFSAIDVDEYPLNFQQLEADIKKHGFPLVVCKSKSGGAHLYLFLKEPSDPAIIRDQLANFAVKLGYAGCEIFPKQNYRINDDSVGNWINLPYYDAENTKRPCIHNGKELSIFEFVDYAESIRTSIEVINQHAAPSAPTPKKNSTNHSQSRSKRYEEGRNSFLHSTGIALVKGGIPHDVIDGIIDVLGEHGTEDLHPNFAEGSLSLSEIKSLKKSIRKFCDKNQIAKSEIFSPEEALEYMNSKYIKCKMNGCTVYFAPKYENALKRKVFEESSHSDISKFYKNKVLVGYYKNGEPRYEAIGKFWLDHPDANSYESVEFLPNKSQDGVLNLWQGFNVEPREGDWSLFNEHLKANVCQGNEEHYNYLIRWFAMMLQKPDTQGHVAIVLKGKKGTGKSFTFKVFGRLLGQHYMQISSARHLTGNFNAHLQDCILLFCDEALWAADKEGENVLKSLITEDLIPLERKGRDVQIVKNHIHIGMASNNEWVVPASHDERRYFVLEIGTRNRLDGDYFASIAHQMDNGGYEALLHDLLNMDLSSYDVRAVPQTEALKEQKLQSLNLIEKWWYGILCTGDLPENAQWRALVSRSTLYQAYKEGMDDVRARRRHDSGEFGKKLKQLVPTLESQQKSDAGKRKWFYILPSLEQCRKDFENFMNASFDWPEIHDDVEEETDEIPF